MRIAPFLLVPSLALGLTACSPGTSDAGPGEANIPGDTGSTQPYGGIAENETLRLIGTEPFWGGTVGGGKLIYTTPENQEGETIAVERFAGRGGISFSGMLGGQTLEMAVTPGECSDGMSDRTYPFTVTLRIGQETRNGCGWSDAHPFEGPEHP